MLTLGFFLAAGFAVFLTGFSKSGFGGGLGVLAVPIMTLFVSPQFAVAVMMPILLAMDLITVFWYRKNWSQAVVATLLPCALIGLAVGAAVFQWIDASQVKLLVGLLAVLFAFTNVIRPIVKSTGHMNSRFLVGLMGALSGFGGFVAHAGGPPVKGYLLNQGFDKTTFVGTNTMFFFVMNILKAIGYAGLGFMTAESLLVSLTLSPLLVVGVTAGLWCHHLFNQKVFVRIVTLSLFGAGVKLIWDGLAD